MNKRGFFLGTMLDMYGWFIFILEIVIWGFVFYWSFGGGSVYTISGDQNVVSDDEILLNYLRTPIEDRKYDLVDLVMLVYEGKKDKVSLKNEINAILDKVYAGKKTVCWNLWYYEDDASKKELLVNEECKGKTKLLFDASTVLPLMDKNQIKIRLTIPGYR